jgi:CHAD domain-containing protein
MTTDEEGMINPGTSLLIDTLEKRWQNYRGELKQCRKEPSEEAIHDLRVATRRLLALVDMLRALVPHPRLGKLRSVLKNQLDSLDDLRDTQVMLVDVSETFGDLPELALFLDYLTKREKRLLRSTAKIIKSFNIANVRKRLDSTRKDLLKIEDRNDQKKELLQIVDEAYETTVRRYQNIEPAYPGTIHRVRVAFKKFRYMVELVHPLISNFPDENLKRMHDYQNLMGDIQDVEVFTATFNDFADNDSWYDPEPVRQYYKKRHSEVIHGFLEEMHQINLFWRPGSGAPFPWEFKPSPKKSKTSKKPAEPILVQEKD